MDSQNPYQTTELPADGEPIAGSPSPDAMARVTWQTFIAVFTLAILSGVVTWVLGEQDDELPLSQQLIGVVMLIFFIRWTTYDSRRFGVNINGSWVLAMLFCTIVAVPVYCFRTRGWSGWLPTLVAFGTLLGTSVLTLVTVELIRMVMGNPINF